MQKILSIHITYIYTLIEVYLSKSMESLYAEASNDIKQVYYTSSKIK